MELFLLILLVPLIIFIWEIIIIINVIQDPNINNNSKLFWVILLLMTNFVGLLIYIIIDNKNILN